MTRCDDTMTKCDDAMTRCDDAMFLHRVIASRHRVMAWHEHGRGAWDDDLRVLKILRFDDDRNRHKEAL